MPSGPSTRVRPGLAPREHRSTRLLALNFDSAASPKLSLGALDRRAGSRAYGWGFAWYPEQSGAALVVKDATSLGDNAMTKLLREWERFESTTFVAHLRGAARALQEQDTHPFHRAHGGRDWVFAHNGDLDLPEGAAGLAAALPLGDDPVHEPIGRTDSERGFCWLLTQARSVGARTLADIGWSRLHGWLRSLDALGTANVIVSDGRDLVVYADEEGYNPLHVARFVPPNVPPRLSTEDVRVGLEDAHERMRTVVMVSTGPLGDGFQPIAPGRMFVVRRGAYIYDSHAGPADRRLMVTPLGAVEPPLQGPDELAPIDGPLSGLTPQGGPHAGPPPTEGFQTTAHRGASTVTADRPARHQRPAAEQVSAHARSDGPGPTTAGEPAWAQPVVGSVDRPPPADGAPSAGAMAPASTSGDASARSLEPAAPKPADAPTPTLAPRPVKIPRLHHSAVRSGEGRLLTVDHRTVYRYETPVEKSSHVFRLQPVHDRWQDLLSHDLRVSVDGVEREYEDVFGNVVTRTDIETPFTELVVHARSLVRVRGDLVDDLHSPHRRFNIPLVWMPWQRQMMTPYLLPPELPESQLRELSDYAMSFVERQDYDLVQTLMDMNITIYRDFTYASASTTIATTPFQVFASRRGVCQDFANLLICLARLLGLPARYRVGYIFTGGDYENKVQSDASHAWAELYLPWTGWQGYDPTNGCLVNHDHVRVAAGRNYGDATPTAGTLYKGGAGETLEVDVEVLEAVPDDDPV